jgi:thiosulfate/3-mercaptopyruvate sulfurtransferase
MKSTTLITPSELLPHLDDPDWAVVDCRFSLAEPERGRRDYRLAHIPGALYAHLDEDLCSQVISGETGRHPLPHVSDIAGTLSEWGVDSSVQVVAYDDAGGAMAAARLWWLLRWLGHPAAAVLDGGWQRWRKEGLPLRRGEERRPRRTFMPELQPALLFQTAEIERLVHNPQFRILDVRSAERYRGENETIDPVAGHIPGAISAPYPENLDAEGNFLLPERLRARYQALLDGVPGENAIFYCGSGVTAAQALLAVSYAGLGEAVLYAGSWSEWITDPNRPIEIG